MSEFMKLMVLCAIFPSLYLVESKGQLSASSARETVSSVAKTNYEFPPVIVPHAAANTATSAFPHLNTTATAPIATPTLPRRPPNSFLYLFQIQMVRSRHSYHLSNSATYRTLESSQSISNPPIPIQLEFGIRGIEVDAWPQESVIENVNGIDVDSLPVYMSKFDAGTTCISLQRCVRSMREWSIDHPFHHPMSLSVRIHNIGNMTIADVVNRVEKDVLNGWAWGFGVDSVDSIRPCPSSVAGLIIPSCIQSSYRSLREAVSIRATETISGLDNQNSSSNVGNIGGWPKLQNSKGHLIVSVKFEYLIERDKQSEIAEVMSESFRLVFCEGRWTLSAPAPWAVMLSIDADIPSVSHGSNFLRSFVAGDPIPSYDSNSTSSMPEVVSSTVVPIDEASQPTPTHSLIPTLTTPSPSSAYRPSPSHTSDTTISSSSSSSSSSLSPSSDPGLVYPTIIPSSTASESSPSTTLPTLLPSPGIFPSSLPSPASYSPTKATPSLSPPTVAPNGSIAAFLHSGVLLSYRVDIDNNFNLGDGNNYINNDHVDNGSRPTSGSGGKWGSWSASPLDRANWAIRNGITFLDSDLPLGSLQRSDYKVIAGVAWTPNWSQSLWPHLRHHPHHAPLPVPPNAFLLSSCNIVAAPQWCDPNFIEPSTAIPTFDEDGNARYVNVDSSPPFTYWWCGEESPFFGAVCILCCIVFFAQSTLMCALRICCRGCRWCHRCCDCFCCCRIKVGTSIDRPRLFRVHQSNINRLEKLSTVVCCRISCFSYRALLLAMTVCMLARLLSLRTFTDSIGIARHVVMSDDFLLSLCMLVSALVIVLFIISFLPRISDEATLKSHVSSDATSSTSHNNTTSVLRSRGIVQFLVLHPLFAVISLLVSLGGSSRQLLGVGEIRSTGAFVYLATMDLLSALVCMFFFIRIWFVSRFKASIPLPFLETITVISLVFSTSPLLFHLSLIGTVRYGHDSALGPAVSVLTVGERVIVWQCVSQLAVVASISLVIWWRFITMNDDHGDADEHIELTSPTKEEDSDVEDHDDDEHDLKRVHIHVNHKKEGRQKKSNENDIESNRG